MSDPQITTRLIYPDPFKPAGIEFDLPESALVTAQVVDRDGKILWTICEQQHLSAGTHTALATPASGRVQEVYIRLLVSIGDRSQCIVNLINT